MKKSSVKTLRRLLCYGLTLSLILSPAFSVFAADEVYEDQNNESNPVNELSIQDAPPEQPSHSPESAEISSPEPASEDPVPAAVDETSEAAYEESVTHAAETTPETRSEETAMPAVEETPESASEETAMLAVKDTPEVISPQNTSADNKTESKETGVVSEETVSTVQSNSYNTAVSGKALAATEHSTEINTKSTLESSSSGQIHIGDASFSSEDDETSHWSEGKGWKNVSGQYVAMVDYDGSKAEISADEGVVTLAVAGVNRIGKLKGNCSFQIAGTGIVLIDSIDIEDGNTLTLHPNTAIYDEGSAAVFVKQDDGSYLLINGDITGILDDVYSLDDVKLVVPEGSSLTISAAGVRTETWYPEDSDDFVDDVTVYTTDLPYNADNRVHETGTVKIEGYTGKVTLGKNSSLIVKDGASVQLKKIKFGLSSIAAELIVQGVLDVAGVIEGGFVDISGGGSVSGDGTFRSSEITLNTEGKISEDILLEKSGLTIYGDRNITPPELKDSIIYLKGSAITIPELKASGLSMIGVETMGVSYSGPYEIGNIHLSSGGSLSIATNDHQSVSYNEKELPRYLEDSHLTISGAITSGAVYVLGGCVEYIGTQYDNLPVVPKGYASRVYIYVADKESSDTDNKPADADNESSDADNDSSDADNDSSDVDIEPSDEPINITNTFAASRANSKMIPVKRLFVTESLVSENILARTWDSWAPVSEELDPLVRKKDQSFDSVADFLNTYGLTGQSSEHTYYTAVELIYSDLSRRLIYLAENVGFDTKDVIMIRILNCIGRGGQGGSSITHTDASLTGSGVIGGPGSGSLKAGSGKVVFKKTSSTKPDPAPEPDPDKNENSDNKENNNITPKPDPAPEPDPEKNENSDNKENNNITPKPDPAPEPDPEKNENKSDDNKENNSNNNNSKNTDTKKESSNTTIRTSTVKAATSAGKTVMLVVTVSLRGINDEDQSAASLKTPQIWHLDVTSSDVPVTDLRGTPVRVVFPFTVPESWGDPAKIANGSLYAVFTDENGKLTAYSAEYDPETGEVSFESEQTGDFVIVRFAYEDESFTEDFYHALAELEEIQLFLAALRD